MARRIEVYLSLIRKKAFTFRFSLFAVTNSVFSSLKQTYNESRIRLEWKWAPTNVRKLNETKKWTERKTRTKSFKITIETFTDKRFIKIRKIAHTRKINTILICAIWPHRATFSYFSMIKGIVWTVMCKSLCVYFCFHFVVAINTRYWLYYYFSLWNVAAFDIEALVTFHEISTFEGEKNSKYISIGLNRAVER